MLSVIIPAYNEQENIEKTAETIYKILSDNKIDCEIMFVDDGSKDRTWELISRLSEENPSIRGLKFSRNFGKEGAIFAGLKACDGDAAVVYSIPPSLSLKWLTSGSRVLKLLKL